MICDRGKLPDEILRSLAGELMLDSLLEEGAVHAGRMLAFAKEFEENTGRVM